MIIMKTLKNRKVILKEPDLYRIGLALIFGT